MKEMIEDRCETILAGAEAGLHCNVSTIKYGKFKQICPGFYGQSIGV
jgi:hypothetical protein